MTNMLLETFLIVLIVALIIGNVLLSLREHRQKLGKTEQPVSQETRALLLPSHLHAEHPLPAQPRANELEERLVRVENLLLRAKDSRAAEAQCRLLSEKIAGLVAFRRHAEIELAALRESVQEKTGQETRITDISDQQLHDLVYRGKTNGLQRQELR